MNIVGHTSHTGSEQANDALSLQRARTFIRQKLDAEARRSWRTAPRPAAWAFARTSSAAAPTTSVDALDRRVEFKIVNC